MNSDDGDMSPLDSATMRALARAIGTDTGSRDLTERSQGLLGWIDVDAELARLLDQPHEELAGTRGAAAASTMLEFTIDDGSCAIEVDVSDDALHGQLLGGRAELVLFRSPDGGGTTAPVDEHGFFVVRKPQRGTLRMEFVLVDGRQVHSDWFVL